MSEIVKVDPSEEGCWLDGHLGQYLAAEIIMVAKRHGWESAEYIDLARRHLLEMAFPGKGQGLNTDDYESIQWGAEAAEDWMNENVAPEGFSFGWFDGEWFLWSDDDWESDE